MLKLVHNIEEEEDLACILKDKLGGLLTQWMMGFQLLCLPKFTCSTGILFVLWWMFPLMLISR